jgi:hypothetical protein
MTDRGPHPFRTAWATRDIDGWAQHFAPDIVLRSPLIRSDFHGGAAARELFDVLFEVISDFDVVHEASDGDTTVFVWRARARGRTFEGVDVVHVNDQGKIDEIAVHIRTLVGLADFAAAVGGRLAARRGRVRGWVLGAAGPGLRAVMATVDRVATRGVQ